MSNLLFQIAKTVNSTSVQPLSTVKNENWMNQFDEELCNFFIKKGPEYYNFYKIFRTKKKSLQDSERIIMDIFDELFQEYKKLSIQKPEGIERKSFVVHKIYESVTAAFSIMSELKIKLDVPLLFCIFAAYVQQYISDQNQPRNQ
ncbi:MAG: hypothetical protein EBR82_12345 [Caulobacteraceae bacterium]|nr:hypothetical protein [Caulobacteraceae bacterium]